MFVKIPLIILLSTIIVLVKSNSHHHQQIHLSFGQKTDEMIVTWVTKHPDQNVHVRYGLNDTEKFQFKARASTSKFVNPGKEGRIIYVHRAIMRVLEPNQLYKYRPASAQSLGPIHTFRYLITIDLLIIFFCFFVQMTNHFFLFSDHVRKTIQMVLQNFCFSLIWVLKRPFYRN